MKAENKMKLNKVSNDWQNPPFSRLSQGNGNDIRVFIIDLIVSWLYDG